MSFHWIDKIRSQRGQAMIETALTLPLLLLLSVSVFEFGRAFQYWQILTNAAREGARVAVLPGTDSDAVTERVAAYIEGGRLVNAGSATVTVVSDDEISLGASTASASTVTVAYPFEFIVLQPVMQLITPGSETGAPLTMTVTATMRNE